MRTDVEPDEARQRLIDLLSVYGYERTDRGGVTHMTRGRRRYGIGATTVMAQFWRSTTHQWDNQPTPVRSVMGVLEDLPQQSAAAQRAASTGGAAAMSDELEAWVDSALEALQNAIADARLRAKESGRQEDAATVEALEAAKKGLVSARGSIRPAAADEDT